MQVGEVYTNGYIDSSSLQSGSRSQLHHKGWALVLEEKTVKRKSRKIDCECNDAYLIVAWEQFSSTLKFLKYSLCVVYAHVFYM